MVMFMLLFLFLITVGLIVFPAQAAQGAIHALRLCGTAVIPALFPFFVLTRLFAAHLRFPQIKRSFLGLSGSCLPALLLSFVGGYPVGVSCVVSLYESGRISKQEAQKAVRICNNSGPGFFIGVIGGVVLQSMQKALILYVVHIVSALLCAQMFSEPEYHKAVIRRLPQKKMNFAESFQSALTASCTAILQVCGLVILFSVLLSLLQIVLPAQILTLLGGILELTNGILRVEGTEYAFVLCAFFMGWGGFCVHMQAMSLWQPAGLQVQGYFLQKLLHGLLSALLAACIQTENFLFLLLCIAICVIFSCIRKKWGRKTKRLAL